MSGYIFITMYGGVTESNIKQQRRKLRYSRCPVCHEVIRSQRLGQHIKKEHRTMSPIPKVKEALYICPNHDPPQYINAMTTKKPQVDVFMNKHESCMKRRVKRKLSKKEEEYFNRIFESEFNDVDLDRHSPVTPERAPHSVSMSSIVGDILGPTPKSYNPPDVLALAANEFGLATPRISSPLFAEPPSFEEQLANYNPLSFNLEDLDRTEDVMDEIRTLFNAQPPTPDRQAEQYREHFTNPFMEPRIVHSPRTADMSLQANAPTLDYGQQMIPDTLNKSTQHGRVEHTDRSMQHGQAEHMDRSMQHDTPDNVQGTDASLQYVTSLNKMKNTMLMQLLSDNILLHEAQVAARKRALEDMEKIYNRSVQADPYNPNIAHYLNQILDLKEQFIERLISENEVNITPLNAIVERIRRIQ